MMVNNIIRTVMHMLTAFITQPFLMILFLLPDKYLSLFQCAKIKYFSETTK